MYTSLNLITPELAQETTSITGIPVRAAGWYGPTNGVHSFSIKVQNFRGRIGIQASLATVPTDSDWFSILPGGIPYIQYPQNGYVTVSPSTGETSTYGFTFTGNIVWARAFMDKSYIVSPLATPAFIATFGRIEQILMMYGNSAGNFDYRKDWDLVPDPGKTTGPQ